MLSHLTDKQRFRSDLILKRILDRRQITRTELSASLGMSSSSIAKYVKILLDAGFVQEVEKSLEGQGGRSAVLELDPAVGF
ncbi:MAG TPA: winged helix-turn-helix transcriptional regulator, partial [Spirochaetia bacterium]|nr:winged helix-turn-helix transcriptional regulator [Spirochaetia bacterium]